MPVFCMRRVWMVAPLLAATTSAVLQRRAAAETPTTSEARARCATRLKSALVGKGVTETELAAANPQGAVDAYLKTPEFTELFARFLNAQFNPSPGMTPADDAAYYLGKHVLTGDLPYKDLFLGKFNVVATDPKQPATVVVQPDPMGLGYFRSRAWLVRYAGNEPAGIKIVTAYRIMQNVTGLSLIAVQNAPGADVSKKGREAGTCAGCHYQGWSALDKVASVLSVRKGMGATMTFSPPVATTTDVDGKAVTDDASLVARLTESEDFSFNACRLGFQFLYGRPENTCESKVFDACVSEFKKSGKIQAALAVIAKDESFCQ
jgi:hypothetical protein